MTSVDSLTRRKMDLEFSLAQMKVAPSEVHTETRPAIEEARASGDKVRQAQAERVRDERLAVIKQRRLDLCAEIRTVEGLLRTAKEAEDARRVPGPVEQARAEEIRARIARHSAHQDSREGVSIRRMRVILQDPRNWSTAEAVSRTRLRLLDEIQIALSGVA